MTTAAITFYRTTIGKKVIMAITGLVWVFYVILHMFGNLKFFVSPESINSWAAFLRTFGSDILGYSGVLWVVRLVLIVSLALHILMAWQLTRMSWAARPVKYKARRRFLAADLSGRSMRWGGVFIGVFLLVHILQLTTGTLLPGFEEGQVYHNVVANFANPLISLFYIIMMVVLALHLYHGTWSLLQSLGFDAYPKNNLWHRLGQAIAILVPLGFVLVPVAVVLGFYVRQ